MKNIIWIVVSIIVLIVIIILVMNSRSTTSKNTECKKMVNSEVNLMKGECAEIITPDESKQTVGSITLNDVSSTDASKVSVSLTYKGETGKLDLTQSKNSYFKDLTVILVSRTVDSALIQVLFNVQ